MFVHVGLWKIAEPESGETKDQLIGRIMERMHQLPVLIPQIKSIRLGADVLHTPASYDLGLVVTFESKEDFLIYRDHPDHVKVGQLISGAATERASIDFIE